MGGLGGHFDPGEASVRAIEAGIDQVLFSPDTDRAIAAVAEAVRSGRIPRARIEESLERIAAAKRSVRAGGRPAGFAKVARIVDAPEHRAVAEEIARRSITLVRDERGLLPLRTRDVTAVVVSDFPEPNPVPEAVRALGAERVVFVDSTTAARSESEPLPGDGLIVMLLALRPKSGAGRIAVPEEAKRIVSRHGARTVAISFGSPYVERDLSAASTFVCAWGIQPVLQQAALEAVRSARFRGRWAG